MFLLKGDTTIPREPHRASMRRNSLEAPQPTRLNGHVPFSPKPARKGTSLCCTGIRASPDNEMRLPPRTTFNDPPNRPPKVTQVSEWPKKDGQLKLSLYNGVGLDGNENGMCYGTLPKPILRNSSNVNDMNYGTLPKNNVNGGGVESNHFSTLTKNVIATRNVNAANSPRDSPTPPVAQPRNGLVTFRFCTTDATQQSANWSPHKINPEHKVH